LAILLNEPAGEGQVKKAQERVQKAKADFDALCSARDMLSADLRSATQDVIYQRDELKQAIGAAVRDGDAVARVIAHPRAGQP